MVSPLFTALAIIAAGRAEVPPAPTQPMTPLEWRVCPREQDGEADRESPRR